MGQRAKKKEKIGDKIKMNNGIPTFVKWAGGKKQLLGQFKKFFPIEINSYLDVFVGGGGVLFYVLKHYKPKEVIISDINPELINAYQVLKNNLKGLIKVLKEHRKNHSKEYYYKIRKQDTKKLSKIERAGRFIYLNKTCFNGLYRVNSKGGFNVPMGSYKNPSIFSEQELSEISQLLKKVKIKKVSFEKCIKWAKKGDFVYLDPPYYPLKKGQSFTTYAKEKFLEKEQEKLKEVFEKLDKIGCKVMLSNSDTPFINDLYKGYTPNIVRARRMINCQGQGRGKINEVVVLNYDPIQKEIS